MIFTDGLSEAVNPEGEDLASADLQQKLGKLHGASADEITTTIEELVRAQVGDTPMADDVTLVVVSRNVRGRTPETREQEEDLTVLH